MGTDWKAESEAEEALLEAVRAGEWAKLESKKGEIRAQLLRALLLGQVGGASLPQEGLRVVGAAIRNLLSIRDCGTAERPLPGLQLVACNIEDRVGRLQLDLTRAHIRFIDLHRSRLLKLRAGRVRVLDGLHLDRVDAKGELNLIGAEIGGDISANGASLSNPGGVTLFLDRANVRGSLFLRVSVNSRAQVEGTIRLLGTTIGGDVDADGASLNSSSGNSVNMDRANIRGSLFLRGSASAPTQVVGRIRLLNASIGGDVDADGASLINSGGDVLYMDRANIRGSLFLRGSRETPIEGGIRARSAEVTGPVDLDGAWITGLLDLQGARLAGGMVLRRTYVSPAIGADETVVNASTAQFGPYLSVDLDEDSRGIIDLRGAEVQSLNDQGGNGWGRAEMHAPHRRNSELQGILLRLNGLTYVRCSLRAGGSPRQWLDDRRGFLMRQFCGECPSPHDYFPQPFEQAARAMRAMGHPEQADEIAREKRHFQARCRVGGRGRQFWSTFLHHGFGHFYRPAYAIRTLLVFTLLGICIMGEANQDGAYGRKPDGVELRTANPPRWQRCWDNRVGPVAGLSQLAEAVFMSLDLLLPLVDLKQNERCEVKDWRAANRGTQGDARREAFWSAVLALYAGLGLVIIPLVVATVSGLARKE